MRAFLAALIALAVVAPAQADETPLIAGPLRSPESANWHPESQSWFVSNMGGVTFDLGPDAGKGFLSRVSKSGEVTGSWIAGLTRPRGVSSSATHVFVAERETLAVIDIATASVIKRISIAGGNGDLNDVAYDRATGWVFISSPSVGAIFAVRQPLSVTAHSEVFAQDPALTQPNGIAIEPGYIVTAGLGLSSPTSLGGKVMRIDRISKEITPVTATGMGALDGIVKDGDDYLVTEYLTGNVYRIAQDGTVYLEFKLAPGTADLGIDPERRVIMVPETLANVVVVLPLL